MRIGEHYTPGPYVREVDTLCDLCGKSTRSRDWNDASEVEIVAKLGARFDEGDQRIAHSVDVCPACFVAKVKPAIEALGCTFREYDEEDGRGFERVDDEPKWPRR